LERKEKRGGKVHEREDLFIPGEWPRSDENDRKKERGGGEEGEKRGEGGGGGA